jgi:hypothetical protein
MSTPGRSSTALERDGTVDLAYRAGPSTGEKQISNSVHYLGDDIELDGRDEAGRATKSSNDDIRGMRRMGKEQQLVR